MADNTDKAASTASTSSGRPSSAGLSDASSSEQIGSWQPVASGVHRLVAEPDTVNVGLVVGSAGAVLIDTGSTPQQGRLLREAVGQVTDLPLLAVIVTHDHHDHAFGLAGFDGVVTIGHESLTESLRSAEARTAAERLGVDPAELTIPERLIAVADVVELGDSRVVEVTHLGDAHSRSDLVVTVTDPATEGFGGVIFAGDLIESAPAERPGPWFGPDSSPDQWSWAVDRLYGLCGPATVIVPGHGEPVGRDFVLEQRDAVDAVRMELERLVASGVAVADAAEQGNWPFAVEHVADGIAAGYAELASAAEQRPGADGRPTLPLA